VRSLAGQIQRPRVVQIRVASNGVNSTVIQISVACRVRLQHLGMILVRHHQILSTLTVYNHCNIVCKTKITLLQHKNHHGNNKARIHTPKRVLATREKWEGGIQIKATEHAGIQKPLLRDFQVIQ